jgi:MazG family protein
MSKAFDRLVAIMDRLRDPGGCPWDREQTLHTLAGYLLEEAHEVVDAIGAVDTDRLQEELGDLLIQVVFMARIAREKGWFEVDDVCEAISDKMVHRHPHVFGDRKVDGADEVVRNWEDIKQDERRDGPEASTLEGVPPTLPALLKAFRMTEKASAVGFDWRRPRDVMSKLQEEVAELEAELDRLEGEAPDRVRQELGDVLFVMANLARHLGVEPETALQETNAKFKRRFQAMEARARAEGRRFREMSLSEQDRLWERVKADDPGTIDG